MFFYIKGTEPTLNGTTKDLDAVFKEENSLNEQKKHHKKMLLFLSTSNAKYHQINNFL